MTILHGDMRFYNNVFVQKPVRPVLGGLCAYVKEHDMEWDDMNIYVGTFPYEDYPTFEEWDAQFEGYCGMGSEPSDRYYSKLPVWAAGNVYLNGAKGLSKEKNAVVDTEERTIEMQVDENGRFTTNLKDILDQLPEMKQEIITTETLGMAFEPEEKYENPDGTPITFDVDFYGNPRGEHPFPGPFEK